MKKLILASSSPRRRELLAGTGLPFEVIPSEYEEDMTLPLSPRELALHLSRGKAEDVASKYPDAVVIGADTFVVFGDKVLGKPHTKERAKEILTSLNGNRHTIITGFTIIHSALAQTVSEAVETGVFFRKLSEKEIDEYIATGEPLDKAGSYAIQGIGKMLVEKIEGDYSNIVGLPVTAVLDALEDFGISPD